MKNSPLLSIVIISHNTADITINCLKSIFQDKGLKLIPYEIILIDNASADDSVLKIKKLIKLLSKAKSPLGKNCKLKINPQNLGFSKANNQGIAAAQGNYLLFLNSDTIILHSAISQSLNWLSSHPEAGACTAQLLNSDKTIQISGGYFPNLLNIFSWSSGIDDLPLINRWIKPFHPHSPQFYTHDNFFQKDRPLDWLSGAFIMVRTPLIKEVGGFDEDYFMYGEEYELLYRIKLKHPQTQFWYLIGPQIIHLGGASSSNKSFALTKEHQGIIAFFHKHRSKLNLRLVKIILRLSPSLYLKQWIKN